MARGGISSAYLVLLECRNEMCADDNTVAGAPDSQGEERPAIWTELSVRGLITPLPDQQRGRYRLQCVPGSPAEAWRIHGPSPSWRCILWRIVGFATSRA